MSKIEVDQVDPQSGTTLTLGTSGDTVSVPSGVTLANAGTVTGIPASAISSGTIATARLGSGTASSSTFLRGDQTFAAPGGGITVADQWRINSNISASASAFTDITANWERVDTAGQGFIGTAMSQSSGIFTFPSTGVYLVQTQLNFVDSSAANTALGCQIAVTVNNSSYTRVADNYTSNHSGSNVNATAVTQSLVDVTNTTNVKVKFQYYVSAAVTIYCPTDVNTSFVTFTRLGDT